MLLSALSVRTCHLFSARALAQAIHTENSVISHKPARMVAERRKERPRWRKTEAKFFKELIETGGTYKMVEQMDVPAPVVERQQVFLNGCWVTVTAGDDAEYIKKLTASDLLGSTTEKREGVSLESTQDWCRRGERHTPSESVCVRDGDVECAGNGVGGQGSQLRDREAARKH